MELRIIQYKEYIKNMKVNLSKISLDFYEMQSVDCKIALLVSKEKPMISINKFDKSISVCLNQFSVNNFKDVLNHAISQILSWNKENSRTKITNHQFLFCFTNNTSLKFGLMEIEIVTQISIVYLNMYEDNYGWKNLMQYFVFDVIKNEYKYRELLTLKSEAAVDLYIQFD